MPRLESIVFIFAARQALCYFFPGPFQAKDPVDQICRGDSRDWRPKASLKKSLWTSLSIQKVDFSVCAVRLAFLGREEFFLIYLLMMINRNGKKFAVSMAHSDRPPLGSKLLRRLPHL